MGPIESSLKGWYKAMIVNREGLCWAMGQQSIPGHQFFVMRSTLDLQTVFECQCGFSYKITQAELTVRRFREDDEALERRCLKKLIEHLELEQAKLNPTLEELKEWGWFTESA